MSHQMNNALNSRSWMTVRCVHVVVCVKFQGANLRWYPYFVVAFIDKKSACLVLVARCLPEILANMSWNECVNAGFRAAKEIIYFRMSRISELFFSFFLKFVRLVTSQTHLPNVKCEPASEFRNYLGCVRAMEAYATYVCTQLWLAIIR